MQLELAIALSCGPESCRVAAIESGAPLEARYAEPMRNRIMIRPGDLVVIDSAASPPEVVWRWWHGVVEGVEDQSAFVRRKVSGPQGSAVTEVRLTDAERGAVRIGDTVFYTHGEGTASLVDVARDGVPAHPEQVRAAGFPEITARYSRL